MWYIGSVTDNNPSDLISSTARCAVGLKVVVCEWRTLKKNPALKSIVAPSKGIFDWRVSTKNLWQRLDGSVFQERFTHIKEWQLAILLNMSINITSRQKQRQWTMIAVALLWLLPYSQIIDSTLQSCVSLLSSYVPFVCILQESTVLVPPEIRYRFVLLFLCRLAERLLLLRTQLKGWFRGTSRWFSYDGGGNLRHPPFSSS